MYLHSCKFFMLFFLFFSFRYKLSCGTFLQPKDYLLAFLIMQVFWQLSFHSSFSQFCLSENVFILFQLFKNIFAYRMLAGFSIINLKMLFSLLALYFFDEDICIICIIVFLFICFFLLFGCIQNSFLYIEFHTFDFDVPRCGLFCVYSTWVWLIFLILCIGVLSSN